MLPHPQATSTDHGGPRTFDHFDAEFNFLNFGSLADMESVTIFSKILRINKKNLKKLRKNFKKSFCKKTSYVYLLGMLTIL